MEKHEPQIPEALEGVVLRLGELERVFGPAVRSVIEAVRADLIAAMAARDRGDAPGAVRAIGSAMGRLSDVAEKLDPADASLMRHLAAVFRTALLQGDAAAARASADAMLDRSGATRRKA